MTSDRRPTSSTALEERLGERFASGLVVALEPPDLHVRRAILEKRARLDDVDAEPDLLEEIAGARHHQRARPRGGADPGRGLRLPARRAAHARARPQAPATGSSPPRRAEPCTVEHDRRARPPSLRRRARRLCSPATAGPPWPGPARSPCTSRASSPSKSLPEIGRGFGGRDHSTVLSAVRSIDAELHRDPELAMTVESLEPAPLAAAVMAAPAARIHSLRPTPVHTRLPAPERESESMHISTAPTSSRRLDRSR